MRMPNSIPKGIVNTFGLVAIVGKSSPFALAVVNPASSSMETPASKSRQVKHVASPYRHPSGDRQLRRASGWDIEGVYGPVCSMSSPPWLFFNRTLAGQMHFMVARGNDAEKQHSQHSRSDTSQSRCG